MAAQQPPRVIVGVVSAQDVTPQFQYVGRVEAVETEGLRVRVEGFFGASGFSGGCGAREGRSPIHDRKAPYEVVVQRRETDLASAKAELKNLEADFKQKSKPQQRGNVSVATLDQARTALATGRAQVLIAAVDLREAKLDLSYTDIYSPVVGKIGRARYSVGNLVGPESDALATVTSADPVYVAISVSEKQLINARLRGIDLDDPPVAPSLILTNGSECPHGGNFDYLESSVDQSTDTVTARAIFANPDRVLLPGHFVTVVVRQMQAVSRHVVPQSALQQDSKGRFVLVVDRESKMEVSRVITGQF